MPGKVPDRWEDYVPFKQPVKGTRFIAFKVPLEQGICHSLPEAQWFTPEKLIKNLESNNYRLGLVVDLTNTKRYYKPSEIEIHGVGYIKINTEGRVVPSKVVREKFFAIVDDFLERNVDNDLLIGVHCTHGLNRTGYMVCRYMIDRMKFVPKEAIEAFNEARGYSMERENYITDLMNSDREEKLPVDNTSDGEIVEDEDSEPGITAFQPKLPGLEGASGTNAATASKPGEVSSPSGGFQQGGFRGRGFQRRGFQNFNQGRGGFQRRPYNNRGFQNNFNRGRGGFQNFGNQDREGGFNRGRGDFRGRGGNFRGNWKQDHGGYESKYNPYDAEDLDEDTEVIITKSERGTIIREERSASQAQKLRHAESYQNKFKRRSSFPEQDDGFSYGSSRGGRQQHREDFQSSWEPERSPPRKFRAYKEDSEEWGSYSRGRGSFKSRGSFEGDRRGGGFKKREETFTPRKSFDDDRHGYAYKRSETEGSYSRPQRAFSPPAARDRSWSPDEQSIRHQESHRYRGRGNDSFRTKEGRGFGRGEGKSQTSRGEGRSYGREEEMDYEEAIERKQYQGRGKDRDYESHEEPRHFRGRGDFRGRGGESRSFGRGRDTSPAYRDAERPAFRGQGRRESYGEGTQRFKEKAEAPFPHQRERSPPEFHERSASFGRGSRSPSFRKKTPGSKFSRDNSPPGFESDISEDSFKGHGEFEEHSFHATDRGRRGGSFRARGTTKQFKSHSRDFPDDAESPPRARVRRMTPPAQYRDREPSPPPFKRRERSPTFRDVSPELSFREESFKSRGDMGFRGRGHDDGFRGRGRGDSQKFRGGGSFQKTRGAFK